MKNKKGLMGTIILSVILATIIIIAFLYYQLKTTGLTFSAGNIEVNLNYNEQDSNNLTSLNNSTIPSNSTDSNLTITEENLSTQEYLEKEYILLNENNNS